MGVLSKQALERRAKVRHRFIEVREVTDMSFGTYEELTSFADKKKVMFMVKKVLRFYLFYSFSVQIICM